MRQLFSLIVVAALGGGCALYTPGGAVVVDPGVTIRSGGDGFCPPGQAKKGNC